MFTPQYTNQFKKDFKKVKKRGYKISLLDVAVDTLLKTGTLPKQYKPHPLSGNYKGTFDAHIKPDWILVYAIDTKKNIITLVRTGSHSDLF